MNRKGLWLGAAAASCAAGCGGRLPSFGADLGMQSTPMGQVRVPYTTVASYFGYVQPGAAPDEVRHGKKMYYLYLWIPIVSPEIGVRMLSPVDDLATPGERDFVDAAFATGDETRYFDTWVRVERCLTAVNPEDIAAPCNQWAALGDNDDSGELPAQPSGDRANSVLRVASVPDDPLKALMRGMYRLAFTTGKAGEVQGSFLAQVGAPIEIPGTAMARAPAELHRIVRAQSR